MEVIKYPNTILKKVAVDISMKEILSDDFKNFIDEMIICMVEHKGLGLSACQIGSNKNIFVCTLRKEGIMTIINPEIIVKSGHYKSLSEGCLSIPDIRKNIKRSKMIKIKYIDINGNEQILRKEKFEAAILQHEMDHLKGKLIIDY